jgi:hypothetical protein
VAKLKALNIALDFDRTHERHNHDLVGYVIQGYPRKVLKATILTRNSIDSWYHQAKLQYPNDQHTFLIGTVSLMGEVTGITDIKDDHVGASIYSKPDPQAN